MKVRNLLNYEPQGGQEFTQPSKTIPDQSQSIHKILERSSRGLPVLGDDSPPLYLGEETSGIDLRTLDLTEKQELFERTRAAFNEYNDKKNQQQKKNALQRLKDSILDEINAEKQKQKEVEPTE